MENTFQGKFLMKLSYVCVENNKINKLFRDTNNKLCNKGSF